MTDPLFDEWRTYQKLLEHDYMHHGAFFNRLEFEIQQRFQGPIDLLDLGCGDTSPIQPMLKERDVSFYCGIDKSETALSKAKANFDSLKFPFRLYLGDLWETLRSLTGGFDVVVASFSLDLLQTTEEKQQVLEECFRVLNPGGLVAIVDVFRNEDETRDEYLQRWIEFAKKNYKALDHEEMACLADHVRSNDFPETLFTYRIIAQAAGYNMFDILLQDREKLNHLVTLRK